MRVLYKLVNLNTKYEGPSIFYLFRYFQWPFVFDIPVPTTLYCLRVEITSRIYSVIKNLVCLDIKHKDIGKVCCWMSNLAEEYALNLHKFECNFLLLSLNRSELSLWKTLIKQKFRSDIKWYWLSIPNEERQPFCYIDTMAKLQKPNIYFSLVSGETNSKTLGLNTLPAYPAHCSCKLF